MWRRRVGAERRVAAECQRSKDMRAIPARHADCDMRPRALRRDGNMRVKLGFKDSAISASVFAIVLFALVSADPRVHDHVSGLFSNAGVVTPFGDRLGGLGSALWSAARHQSLDNAPMLVLATVGPALTIFRLKS